MRANIPKSYLYQQYFDDEDLQAFVNAYNTLAQQYLDWFNNLNLPIYTLQSGLALDWVALGLYGLRRPSFPFGSITLSDGVYNSTLFNVLPYDTGVITGTPQIALVATDDLFRRVITWNFYKGDGYQFNIKWLKNRVYRFLNDVDGIATPLDNTYKISVTFSPENVINIVIYEKFQTEIVPILQSAINSQILQTPFQYRFQVIAADIDWVNDNGDIVRWRNNQGEIVAWD
jgi:hypothetical protein